jgi:hypothetical protein
VKHVIVVAVVLAASSARAEPCDGGEAARIDRLLRADRDDAVVWREAWGAGFFVAAAGQLGASALVDGQAQQDGLEVGAAKASLGALSRLVLPLRVTVPPPATGDACRDLDAARGALRATKKAERRTFWLNLVGGVAVNVAGLLYMGLERDAWREGLIGFGISLPIGAASAFTMPRRAWRD